MIEPGVEPVDPRVRSIRERERNDVDLVAVDGMFEPQRNTLIVVERIVFTALAPPSGT
jgi:hypothetical protein